MSKQRERDGGGVAPKSNPNQKLPTDHYDRDGLSNGPKTGAVRKTWDAEQGSRPKGEQTR